jgi:hypothetical protein
LTLRPAPVRRIAVPDGKPEAEPAHRSVETRWQAEAGVVAMLDPSGDVPASWAPRIGGGLEPVSGWTFSIEGVGPAFSTLTQAAGDARVDTEWIALSVEAAPFGRIAAGVPIASVTLGARRIGVRGYADEPEAEREASQWVAHTAWASGLRFLPLDGLEITPRVHALLPLPRPVVVIGDESVALPQPALAGSLSVGARW